MKQKCKHICVTFLISLLFICNSNNGLFAQNTSDSITVIFNNTPKYAKKIEVAKNIFVERTDPIVTTEDNFHYGSFEPNSAKFSDTLRIKPSSLYILLKHRFNTVSFMYYLFKKGDTVVFSYKDSIPIAKVLNRATKGNDTNYELSWRNRITHSSYYTPYEIYLEPFFTVNKTDQDNIVYTSYKIKSKNYYLAKNIFLQEQQFLDSIKEAGDISEDYYNFYSDKCKYLTAMMGVEQGEINADAATKIKPPTNAQLPYSFYYNFITSFVNSTIEKKAKIINLAHGQIADFRQIFDFIEKDSNIQSPYKDLLLHKYLILIANSFAIKDYEKYLSKFKKNTTDGFLITDIQSRYLIGYPNLKSAMDTLFLMDSEKSKLTLKNILDKNKGKLIYIDFWASWCAPCRAAMPSSALLRNKYKNILFLYLSIDTDFNAWEKANVSEGLSQYPNSFFILNSKKNRFLEKINLSTIPRYLIFDKTGKLIHQNAPGPQSKELIKVFSGLIY